LPRGLSFCKDFEEEGFDKILIAEITDRLNQAAHSTFNNNLYLDTFESMDSKKAPLLQIADLFSSSLNRVINESTPGTHARDEFASYFLNAVGIVDGLSQEEQMGDITVHMKL